MVDECSFKFSILNDDTSVILEFGKPVEWIEMNADTAIEVGMQIIAQAKRLQESSKD